MMSRMMEPAFVDIDTEDESIRRTRGTLGCMVLVLMDSMLDDDEGIAASGWCAVDGRK